MSNPNNQPQQPLEPESYRPTPVNLDQPQQRPEAGQATAEVVLTPQERLDAAIKSVALARHNIASSVGRKYDTTGLGASLTELRDATAAASEHEVGSEERILEDIASMEKVSKLQVELAAANKPKEAGRLARWGAALQSGLNKPVVKKLLTWLPVAAAVAGVTAAVITTGGAGLIAAAPAILTKGLIGLGVGGVGKGFAHVGAGIVAERKARLAEHTEEATASRVANELAAQKAAATPRRTEVEPNSDADPNDDRYAPEPDAESTDTAEQEASPARTVDPNAVYQTAFEQTVTTRGKNNERRRDLTTKRLGWIMAKGAVKGFAMGTLAGVGLSGFGIHTPNFLGNRMFGVDFDQAADQLSGSKAVPGNGTPTKGLVREATPGGKGNVGTGDLPKLNADQARAAEVTIINNKINAQLAEGQANVQVAADHFKGKGDNLWAKYQNAAGKSRLSNHDTWAAIVGDGPKNGGLEQMHMSNLFDVDMGGQAKMTDNGIKFSGDKWWVEKTTAKSDMVIYDATGKPVLSFKAGQVLTQNQQAATLQALSQKGATMADYESVFNQQDKLYSPSPELLTSELKVEVSKIIDEFNNRDPRIMINGVIREAADLTPEELASYRQGMLYLFLSGNADRLAVLPDSYLKAVLQHVESQVPPQEIERISKEILGRELELV